MTKRPSLRSDRRARFAIIRVTCLTALLACSLVARAETVRVSGIVQGEEPYHPKVVRLKVTQPSFDRRYELPPSGLIEITIGESNRRKSTITCEISAPGFEPQRIRAVIGKDHRASIGIVRLKPFVALGPLTIARADSGALYADVWIKGLSSRPLVFRGVTVAATEAGSPPCFDASPQLTMRFTRPAFVARPPTAPGTIHFSLQVHEPRSHEPGDSLSITGTILTLSCGAKLLKLAAPYSFSLSAADKDRPIKVRIELPAMIETQAGETIRPDWSQVTVSVEMSDGEILSATAS